MKSTSMNELISELNGCLKWTGFGIIGLDRIRATEVLERWFEWDKKANPLGEEKC